MMLQPTSMAWVRLQARRPQELEPRARTHGSEQLANGAFRIRCTRLVSARLLVTDTWWRVGDDTTPLWTMETAYGELDAARAHAALQAQGLPAESAHTVALTLLRQLLEQALTVLDAIDTGLSVARHVNARMLRNIGTDAASGIEDVTALDAHLSTLHAPLSFVIQSLHDVERAAHQLRRAALHGSRLSPERIEEFIAEVEGAQRRARFTRDRQRFHQALARDTIAMSDLNVVKVFTVLWAIFVPGTALINWYGQNFQFMPELAWAGSSIVQMLGTMVVTAVPILIIRMAGALR